MFNVKETIRLMMAKKGYSLADICEEYNKKTEADFKRETFFISSARRPSKPRKCRLSAIFSVLSSGWLIGIRSKNRWLFR